MPKVILTSTIPSFPKSNRTIVYNSPGRPDSDQPRQFPEIPQLPKRSQENSEPVAQPLDTTARGQAPHIDPAHDENLIQIAADPVSQLQSADAAVASDDSTALAHSETEDSTPTQMLNQSSSNSGTPAAPSLSTLPPMAEAGQTPPSQTRQNIKESGSLTRRMNQYPFLEPQ